MRQASNPGGRRGASAPSRLSHRDGRRIRVGTNTSILYPAPVGSMSVDGELVQC